MERLLEYLSMHCWNCEKPLWVCDLKHLVKDVGYGLLVGGVVGGVIGYILATIYNLFFSPFGRFS